MSRFLLVFSVAMLIAVGGCSKSAAPPPPSTPEALAEQYRQAVEHRDEAAIRRLCYSFDTADDGKNPQLAMQLLLSPQGAFRVSVTPLEAGDEERQTKTVDGVTFSLQPRASNKLRITYDQELKTGEMRVSGWLIGEKGGVYYISTYQREP